MISLNQGHGGAPSVYSNPFPGCIFREARPFSKGEEDENTPSVIFYLDTTDSHGKTTTVNIRLSFAPCAPEESQAVTITIFYPESNQKIKEFTNVTDFINFISKKTSQEENIESACFL